MLDYIENCLWTIGDFFNFFGDSIEVFWNWFLSSYPLTFRLFVAILIIIGALLPFFIAAITFKYEE